MNERKLRKILTTLYEYPYLTLTEISNLTKVAFVTVRKYINILVKVGVVEKQRLQKKTRYFIKDIEKAKKLWG